MKWFYQCTLCELSTKSIFKVIGHWFLHFFFHLYAHLKTKFWINITSQSSTSWGCHGYVAALKSMSHMISTTHVCLMVSNARNSQSTAHEQSKTQCCREDLRVKRAFCLNLIISWWCCERERVRERNGVMHSQWIGVLYR